MGLYSVSTSITLYIVYVDIQSFIISRPFQIIDFLFTELKMNQIDFLSYKQHPILTKQRRRLEGVCVCVCMSVCVYACV